MKKEELKFINLNYKPDATDLVCLFSVEPARGLSLKQVANTIALESSIGTWTDVSTKKAYVEKLAAKVFSIRENRVKIAYPQELFEEGNAPNILSSIAGNIFGMKSVKSLRLEDVSFPKKILNSFFGPKFGIRGIRKILKIKSRPLVGTIIKPKLGLRTLDHAKVAYDSWLGGCDLVKDDENLASQKFNEFENRLSRSLEAANRAQEETGEKKAYLVNITAETKEMMKRTQLVEDFGGKFVMVDVVTEGFGAVQSLRESDFNLAIHGHRAMHAAFTRSEDYGIAMMVLADLVRLIGIDSLHIGTGIGKMEGGAEEVEDIEEEIELKKVKETRFRLAQDWGKIKPVMAVCSGGIYPGHVPYLIKHFGKDIIIQAGGGIHGHPDGTQAGASAMRQAVDAVLKGKSLKSYGKKREELGKAMDFWKKIKF